MRPKPVPAAERAVAHRPRALGARFALLAGAVALSAIVQAGAHAGAQAGGALFAASGAPMKGGSLRAERVEMPFERAESNFPGSAFFYLEDSGADAAQAVWPSPRPLRLEASPTAASPRHWNAGPAASAFALSAAPGVSALDRARALRCLTMAIYYEAASESEAGQRAVAQVVLNRVAHPAWPNNVCAVVFEGAARATGCQFTFTCDGSLARKPSRAGWRRAQRVAARALSGEVFAPVGLATHYHTLWVDPYWASSLDPVAVIGAHRFYRGRGRQGAPSAFNARYRGGEAGPTIVAPRRNEMVEANAASPRRALPAGPPSNATLDSAPVEAAHTPGAPTSASPLPLFESAGRVRREYARAGQWIAEPGATR